MPRYRVTLRRSSVEIVEASNQYQAAIVARDLFGDSVEVADVAPAVGRPPVTQGAGAGGATKTTKKVAKKRRPLSPEGARQARAEPREGPRGTRRQGQGHEARREDDETGEEDDEARRQEALTSGRAELGEIYDNGHSDRTAVSSAICRRQRPMAMR